MSAGARRSGLAVAGFALAGMLLTACGGDDPGTPTAEADAKAFSPKNATMVIPFGSGGGVDLAGRTAVQALTEEGIVDNDIDVRNVEGGDATLGMSQVKREDGSGDTLMITGTHLVVTPLLVKDSGLAYTDFTPLATLFAEYAYIYAAPDSKYQTIQDVVAALQEDPGSVKIGGGSPGGSSHFAVAGLANSLGIKVADLTYVAYDDNEMIPAVLGGHVDIASSGPELLDLVEADKLKVLAVSSQEPVAGRSEGIPTFADAGSDAEVVNFRVIAGPPNMPKQAVDYWQDALAQMVETPTWTEAMETNGWAPYVHIDDVEEVLATTHDSYSSVLAEMGLI